MHSLSCLERAIQLVSMSRMSSGELRKKLLIKGETEEETEASIKRLIELGLLNDREYAFSVVRHYSSKGYGESYIRNEFRRRIVPSEYWDEALDSLPDTSDILQTLISKKLKDAKDKSQIRKVCDSLCRRGFSYNEIHAAIEKFIEEEGIFDG